MFNDVNNKIRGGVTHTCPICMLVSQVKGRAEVRSFDPSSVDMMPLRSTLRIIVPSTK